jgi:hypothetical protein
MQRSLLFDDFGEGRTAGTTTRNGARASLGAGNVIVSAFGTVDMVCGLGTGGGRHFALVGWWVAVSWGEGSGRVGFSEESFTSDVDPSLLDRNQSRGELGIK